MKFQFELQESIRTWEKIKTRVRSTIVGLRNHCQSSGRQATAFKFPYCTTIFFWIHLIGFWKLFIRSKFVLNSTSILANSIWILLTWNPFDLNSCSEVDAKDLQIFVNFHCNYINPPEIEMQFKTCWSKYSKKWWHVPSWLKWCSSTICKSLNFLQKSVQKRGCR